MMVATAATCPRVAAAEALLLRQKSGSRHTGCGQTAATIENEKYENHKIDHGRAASAPNGQYRVLVAAAKILIEEATCVLKQRETREVRKACERHECKGRDCTNLPRRCSRSRGMAAGRDDRLQGTPTWNCCPVAGPFVAHLSRCS